MRAFLLLLMSSAALAQPATLPAGWSIVDRTGLSSPVAIACDGPRAVMRDWTGMFASWDGARWSLQRRQESMYGRTLALAGDHVFLESGSSIAEWDGTHWTDHALSEWQGDGGAAMAAISAHQVYYVGRGRIAAFDGTSVRTFDAGTWRSLSAIAIVDDHIWIGGQGGTILRRDAGTSWARETTGTEAWIRSIVAFASNDVWALVDGARYDQSTILHYDGQAWTHRETGLQGVIDALATTREPAFYATGTAGLWRWDGSAWVVEIAQSALGGDSTYYGLHGVCATDHHLIVGFGPHALMRTR